MQYFCRFFIIINSSTVLASRQKPSLAQVFLLRCYASLTGTNLLQGCVSHPLTPPTPGCPWGPSGSGGSFPTSPMTKSYCSPTPQSLRLLSLSEQQLHLGGQPSHEGWENELRPSTTISNRPDCSSQLREASSASTRAVLVLATTRDTGQYKISPHISVYIKYAPR